jgi:hypothetical protein
MLSPTEQVGQIYEPVSMDDWLGKLASVTSDVLIFQNVYDDRVISQLDPSFLPVEGRRNARTETREVGLFLRMFHTGLYRCAPLTGILSPSFKEKAKISGNQLLDFIRRNPGYNVYFINPFPQNAYFAYNVWYHGELYHPGLFALAEILFERAGYDTKHMYDSRDSHATLLYSSYWVGDQQFWDGYMALITRLMETLGEMPRTLLDRYYSIADYRDWRTSEVLQVSYLPFIFERTFSIFLHIKPDIRAMAYPFTRGEILAHSYGGDFESEIVQTFGDVVDEIDRRGEYTTADRQVIFALYNLRAAAEKRRWAREYVENVLI